MDRARRRSRLNRTHNAGGHCRGRASRTRSRGDSPAVAGRGNIDENRGEGHPPILPETGGKKERPRMVEIPPAVSAGINATSLASAWTGGRLLTWPVLGKRRPATEQAHQEKSN